MKRPAIKEKAAQEYADYLEDRLARFEANNTITRFYRGLKKQVDNISKLFEEIKVTETDLRHKDDKFFDRYFKYLEKSGVIAEALVKMMNMIAPSKEDERKIKEGASLENYVMGDKGKE